MKKSTMLLILKLNLILCVCQSLFYTNPYLWLLGALGNLILLVEVMRREEKPKLVLNGYYMLRDMLVFCENNIVKSIQLQREQTPIKDLNLSPNDLCLYKEATVCDLKNYNVI